MKYLLDTNVVIRLMAQNPALQRQVQRHAYGDLAISAIVTHELYFGACRSVQRDASMSKLDNLSFPILPFDDEDALQAAEIRAQLAFEGRPIGPYDTLIAGQARARNLTLVTHNTREFARVDGLRIEDWEQMPQ